jgi:integrase
VNVIHFAKEPGRTRRLEGDEEQRLLQHATTPMVNVLIRAGLEAGCRIGELLQLTWADVKWDQNVLLLPAAITKTDEARDIPLTQTLRALLELRQHAPDGTVFGPDAAVFGNEVGEPVKYWRVHQAWHATCAAAGITGLHFHDLRRELASTLRESGAPDHIVADVLGHANISTTSKYLKASRASSTSSWNSIGSNAPRSNSTRPPSRDGRRPGRVRTLFVQSRDQPPRTQLLKPPRSW